MFHHASSMLSRGSFSIVGAFNYMLLSTKKIRIEPIQMHKHIIGSKLIFDKITIQTLIYNQLAYVFLSFKQSIAFPGNTRGDHLWPLQF